MRGWVLSWSVACLAAAVALAACKSSGSPAGDPSSQPGAASSQPGGTATSTDAAIQLAHRVYAAAGGEQLDRVAQLDFTFVVYIEGAKKASVKHSWDLKGARDRVVWTDRQGVARDVVVSIAAKPPAGDVDAEKAYARWVNDTYWFVLPLKVLDPGVRRTLEAPREFGGKTYDVLRLQFAGVGLTPGDSYWLFVDRDSHRIVRWEMVLQGSKPGDPPEANSWEDYRALGPLMLAHDHVSDDQKERIVLEDTAAHEAVVAGAFEKTAAP